MNNDDEDIELHELETIERNLSVDVAPRHDASDGFAVMSPSGFAVMSPSGFAVMSPSGFAVM